MFKEIFVRLYQLIVHPSVFWQKLDAEKETNNDQFLSRFLYPIMGLAALSCVSGLWRGEGGGQSSEIVVLQAFAEFIKFFVGFYLLTFLFKEIQPHLSINMDKTVIDRFIGSLLAIYMTVDIVLNLLPHEFSYLKPIVLGIFYPVRVGAQYFLHIKESRFFTLLVTIMVLLIPYVVEFILHKIIPGIN